MSYLCLYHADCSDGFGAALAFQLYCEANSMTCEFVPMHYGDTPPDTTDRHVLVVDFSFKRDVLLEMNRKAKFMRVIDHHKSAEQELSDLTFCIFDLNHSGAVLTWMFFFPNAPVPLLFKYLEDRDLWRWKLPNSHEVSAAVKSYPAVFEQWRRWLNDEAVNDLSNEGEAILRYQAGEVARMVKNAYEIRFAGFNVLCLNTNHLISEVGNELCKGRPFSVTYFDLEDKRVFSLRSEDRGSSLDVSELAKRYGCGGHPHAAGFSVEMTPELKRMLWSFSELDLKQTPIL